jgi:acyl dehydratase
MAEEEIYFEDVEVGDMIPPLIRKFTTDDVRAYLDTVGLFHKRFVDDDYARTEGLDRAIIPGNISLGLLSQLLTSYFPADSVAKLSANFRGFVRTGIEFTCMGMITEKHSSGGQNLLECEVYLQDENGQRPVKGRATIRLRSRGDHQ